MIGSRTHECTVIVVGDSGVGKTTLITTFNSEKTTLANINTIGVVNVNKEIGIQGNNLMMKIFDTAG